MKLSMSETNNRMNILLFYSVVFYVEGKSSPGWEQSDKVFNVSEHIRIYMTYASLDKKWPEKKTNKDTPVTENGHECFIIRLIFYINQGILNTLFRESKCFKISLLPIEKGLTLKGAVAPFLGLMFQNCLLFSLKGEKLLSFGDNVIPFSVDPLSKCVLVQECRNKKMWALIKIAFQSTHEICLFFFFFFFFFFLEKWEK